MFLVGMIATLATLPGVAAASITWLGRKIASLRSPAGLVGGRWLVGRPALTSRLVAATAVGLGVLSQLAVIGTIDAYQSGWRPDMASDEAVVIYARGASDRARADFVAATGGDRVLEIRAGQGGYVPVLVGDCGSLAQVAELERCPEEPLPTSEVFAAGSAIGRAATFETELVASSTPPGTEPWGFFVLNPDGSAGVEEIRRDAHRSLPLASTQIAGQLGRAVEPSMTIRIGWMYAAGAAGVLLLVVAGGLAVLSMVAVQARSLGALGGIGAPPSLFTRVVWWNVGLPLLVTLGASVSLAAFLAFLAVRLRGAGEIPWSFLGAGAVICVLLAGVVTMAAAVLTRRAVPGWRPTGD